MSRETDSSSSGPQGRGGSPYPSGPEPYGPGAADADEAAASGADPSAGAQRRPDDRKTETTITTRIRINIPGSRPIPPVVVRKPVGDSESGGAEDVGGAAAGAELPRSPLTGDGDRSGA
ncbi:MAG: hypothetical protein ACRDP3_03300, partial [Streptomyces sp.]